jgi:Dehydrogenases with different specificities (related to short-chain alcohol dehydrogenases)
MPSCFIAGASRGIGLEFVRQYAADGWTVHAACRRAATAQDLLRLTGDVRVIELDVTDFAAVDAVARTLDGQAIDLLINNAGIYGPRTVPYDFVDYAVWDVVMRTNVMAPLKLSAALSKHVARSRRKLIVSLTSNMGSITENTSGGAYIYRSSKAALNAVMRSLAIDLRGKEIAVVLIHPGWVRTDMGGPGALMEVETSVAGMRRVIEELDIDDTGNFFSHDGKTLPW